MILDEIQEAYFKHNYENVIGVKLLISMDIYKTMLKQDERMVLIGRPDSDGSLPPMFGRPVIVMRDLGVPWAWSVNSCPRKHGGAK